MRYLLLALLMGILAGCSGGGGVTHRPPKEIIVGQPATLHVAFTVWGSGSGDLAKRYTTIICHYRKTGEAEYHQVPARIITSDQYQMAVDFVIPPQEATKNFDSLEYYFDFLFDGVANREGINTVRIVAPGK